MHPERARRVREPSAWSQAGKQPRTRRGGERERLTLTPWLCAGTACPYSLFDRRTSACTGTRAPAPHPRRALTSAPPHRSRDSSPSSFVDKPPRRSCRQPKPILAPSATSLRPCAAASVATRPTARRAVKHSCVRLSLHLYNLVKHPADALVYSFGRRTRSSAVATPTLSTCRRWIAPTSLGSSA